MLFALALGACSSTPRQTASEIPPATVAALRHLHPGMTESQAREIMQPVSLNWARVGRGGARPGELWFQVSVNQQVRVALEPRRIETRFWTADVIALFQRISFKPVFVVAYIGQPEPKTPWKLDAGHNLIE